MKTNRKREIIVGVLFLLATATYMTGFAVFIGPVIQNAEYISLAAQNPELLAIGVLLEYVCALTVIAISIFMLPILKKYNKDIAIGYLGFRTLEGIILIIGGISILFLLALSRKVMEVNPEDAANYEILGSLFIKGHHWAYLSAMIITGLGGFMFCYLMYKVKLVPRILSLLGLTGYALLSFSLLMEMFGMGENIILLMPLTLFEALLPIWLFLKGFNYAE